MRNFIHWVVALFVLMGCSSKLDKQLVLAASEGKLLEVQSLLSQGANVNYHLSDNGTTALIAAAQNGHLSVVKALLATDADINAVDHDVGAALYWAAFNGKVDVMKFLLSKGAKLNCSSKAASYLLKTMLDRNFLEAEALTQSQLQREGIRLRQK